MVQAGTASHYRLQESARMTEPIRLALIDDDDAVLDALRQFFFARRGIITSCFTTAGKFLETFELRQQFDSIVSDVRMPDMSGLDLMRHLNQRSYALEVILITGHGDVDIAVAAMKEGAFDFIESHSTKRACSQASIKPLDRDDKTRVPQRNWMSCKPDSMHSRGASAKLWNLLLQGYQARKSDCGST
jgi:FixJ family two-component response regulator